jgi:hypothetical protein
MFNCVGGCKVDVLTFNFQFSTFNFYKYGIYGTADSGLFERNGRG